MDFVKIIRSVEEALYEVMSWLVFYPLTLWRVLRHPLDSMAYSDGEQRDKPEQQYLETLSPPLFLVLSLLIAHGLGLVLKTPHPVPTSELGKLVLGSVQNLMIMQALVFSVQPLLYATALVWSDGRKLDRDSLKAPFFAQCYLAGATSILVSLAGLAIENGRPEAIVGGSLLLAVTTLWYLNVQRRWFVRLERMTQTRAILLTVGLYLASCALMLTVLVIVAV